ncbi:MAG: hypothetical protein WAT93_00330 [Pontixanthobacter sp.]
MSHREKSAWLMAAIMVVTGLVYAWLVARTPEAPVLAPLIPYILMVILLAIAGQIVLAIYSPREAQAAADEREKLVIARAGHWSGLTLATAIVLVGGIYIFHPSGIMLFHHVVGALILAQIAEYGFQIFLFRRAI